MFYKNCPEVLESYLRYLELVKGYSQGTLLARYQDICDFLRFIRRREGGGTSPEELAVGDVFINRMTAAEIAALTPDDVDAFLENLERERHISNLTIFRRKAPSLGMFYGYLIQQQEELGISIAINPVQDRRDSTPPSEPSRILSPAEINRVLDNVQGKSAVRDIAIILLISTTGLSVCEVVKIRCKDYNHHTITVNGRQFALTENCRKAIDRYLFEYRDPCEEWIHDNALFVSKNYQRRLTTRGLRKALQRHFDRAGVVGTAKDLRYTAVITLLKTARNECERSYIAGYLGYTNPVSLQQFPLPPLPSVPDTPLPSPEDTWLSSLGR